jgi:ankyrin repeat protein
MEQRQSPRSESTGAPQRAKTLPSDVLLDATSMDSLNAQLIAAASKGNEARVRELLLNGASPNAEAPWEMGNWRPLHYAAESGHIGICRLLIENGATVDARNTHMRTPLYFAAINFRAAACAFLVSKGANPEAKEENGLTPASVWPEMMNSMDFLDISFGIKFSDAFLTPFLECIGA